MSIPSKDISEILQTDGVGVIGTSIFYGKMPDNVEPVIAVYDAGGSFSNPKWKRDELTIQVLVRGPQNAYETGYDIAYNVKNSLLGHDPVTINGSLYSLFTILGDINGLGYDDSNRARFSMRFKVVRENFDEDGRLEF